MSKIKLLAGDFQQVKAVRFGAGCFLFTYGLFKSETIKATDLEELEVASEENLKRLGGTLGWGIVGGLALGGVGALAGLLVGGRSKEVTFVAKFKDGRKLLATTEASTFKAIQAAIF